MLGLEALVTVLDEVVLPRSLDPQAGVWLLRDDAIAAPVSAARDPKPPPRPSAAPPAPTHATANPHPPVVPPPRPSAPDMSASPPVRPPVRQVADTEEGPYPQAGDIVEHFAFGTCEVLKSDGDRLHVKMVKDSRIREIALEMLRVTSLTNDGEVQRYRLDRKL